MTLAERTRVDAPPAPPRRRRRLSRTAPLWFLLPALVFYAALVVVPSVAGIGYSFTNSTTGGPSTWVGLGNYISLLSDPATFNPLIQTIAMALGVMVLQNGIGLLLALACNTAIKSRNLLRVAFFTPFILSPLVAGFLWKYILDPTGPLNSALDSVGLNALAQPWLADPTLALAAIVVTVGWQFSGSSMAIYLAGLQSVPAEVLEAASLDGASSWQRFWNVTRPALAPAFTINLTLSLIAGLRLYDQIQAMTSGGPGGATDTISTVIYRVAFTFGQLGLGAALAVLLTILVVVFSGAQYLGLRKQASA